MELISTNICNVTVEHDMLKASFPPPSRGAYGFLIFFSLIGLWSIIYGLVQLKKGGGDAVTPILSGLLLPCIPLWSIWGLREIQGIHLIDKDGVRWIRDGVEIESSPKSDVTFLTRRSRSWQSHRIPSGSEYWLIAKTSSGNEVYFAHGRADEIASVRSWIEECWGL